MTKKDLNKGIKNLRSDVSDIYMNIRRLNRRTVVKETAKFPRSYHNVNDIVQKILDHLGLEIKSVEEQAHVVLEKKKKTRKKK